MTSGLRPETVTVVPFEHEDLGFACALAALMPERWLRVCRRGLPNPHEMRRAATEGVLEQFVVRVDEVPVGISSIHDVSIRHRRAWMDVVLVDGVDHVVERMAALHVVDRAFTSLPIRLLGAAHLEIHPSPFAAAGLDTQSQARLPHGYLHEGTPWERVLTILDRSTWEHSREGARS